MSETVTVTPRSDRDDDGNPVANGSPVTLSARAIAPGNTTVRYTESGNVDNVAFTVFLRLGAAVKDGDLIKVRNQTCVARVQEWRSPWSNRGGVVVLAESVTGAS
jgi:hypothetical protein